MDPRHSYSAIVCALLITFPHTSLSSLDTDSLKKTEKSCNSETFLRELIFSYSNKNFRFMLHTESARSMMYGISTYEPKLSNIFSPKVEVERLVIDYSETSSVLRRPFGLQFINIVLLDQLDAVIPFFEISTNVQSYDRVIFVTPKTYLQNQDSLKNDAFWKIETQLSRFRNVVFVSPSESGMEVYDTCYFCGSYSGILRLIGLWNSSVNLTENEFNIFPDYFLDFNGHEFKVIFVPYPPIIWCDSTGFLSRKGSNISDEVCVGELYGPEGNIFNSISRSLNFTSRLIDFYSMPESHVKTIYNIGAWDILIDKMSESLGDIAIGSISLTLSRTLQVPFTQIFNREPHDFVYIHFDGSSMGVTGPFSLSLWICLTIAWFSISFLICSLGSSNRMHVLFCGMWSTGAMLLGQGTATPAFLLKKRSIRLILLCWCWFSFILMTLYASNLVSSLINQGNSDDPTSLEDLLIKKYEVITAKSSIFAVRALLNSSDPVYRTLGGKMKVLETFEACVEYLIKSVRRGTRVAIVEENSILRWGIGSRIPASLLEVAPQSLRMGGAEILASGHAWAIQKDGIACIPTLNRALGYAIASGLPRYWIDRTLRDGNGAIPYGSSAHKQLNRVSQALPLKVFLISLSIWAGGLFLSLLSFCIEIITGSRRCNRKKISTGGITCL